MKVLHIIPTYLPAPLGSGPIQAVHALNKELVRQGVDVTVYTSDLAARVDKVEIDGIKVYYFPTTIKSWGYSRKMHKFLKANIKNFDLVHISSIFLAYLTLCAYYARKFKIPYVVSAHGMLMKHPLASKSLKKKIYLALFDKRNLSSASAVHFTTDLEKRESEEAGITFQNTWVIPHGIEPDAHTPAFDFRKKFSVADKEKVILFMGRLNWIKGFDTLLQAFAIVVKELDALLVIAGPDGGYKNKIEDSAKELGVTERVLFTGEVEGGEKVAAFAASDIFVLPSISENFSVAAGEAMEKGLPVVVSEGVGVASIIEQYGAGLVVHKESSALAEAILKILRDENLASSLGESGRKLVEEEFTPKIVAEKILAAYKALLGKH